MPKSVLIIDNGSKYLHKLERIAGPSHHKTVMPGELDVSQAESFDAIFLSGGFQHEVMEDPGYFKTEIALINRGNVPIIGVCLGFQVIAYAGGMPVHKMPRKEHATLTIYPTDVGEKILGTGPFQVYENHRWVVSKTPEDFHALATSKDGVEAIMHTQKPIVGFQFHPEMFVSENDGRDILRTVMEQLTSQ